MLEDSIVRETVFGQEIERRPTYREPMRSTMARAT